MLLKNALFYEKRIHFHDSIINFEQLHLLNDNQIQMFRPLLVLVFSVVFSFSFGQNFRAGHHCRMAKHSNQFSAVSSTNSADSIHIQHYDIRIDSLNFTGQSIWGVTTLIVESKVDGLDEVRLSLDGFTVDSVNSNSSLLTHSYDGLNLNIELLSTLNTGDLDTISVTYHGSPAQDPSGWGGYYWNGSNYAFNMGVGFEEDPHVFGRAWFPCLDVFTDRATYDFHIWVPEDYQAFCNGELDSVEAHPNGSNTYHWKLEQTIPTYLASMAVAEYHFLERTYSGIPTVWAAWAQDTNNVLSTFQHMEEAVDAFIDSYGPYRWDKIGYALVPFNAGAMEHASSIHIGKPFVNGSLTYETLWVHELAHMWWGDLVTCKNQENMWLNEGFAAYSEALFTEVVYGEEAYKDWIRGNHRKVLQFSHVNDEEYYAMNAVPHSVTYGSTVYEKGPDVIHTLRNFMGDDPFFEACQHYMDSLEFGNANSHDLRDEFEESSGLDLTPFFEGWIFQPGFPHFAVDSFSVQDAGLGFDVSLYFRQKQRGNSHIYDMEVPINLTSGEFSYDVTLTLDESTQGYTISCPFAPTMVTIDRWQKMSDAIADYELKIGEVDNYEFNQTNVQIEVMNAGSDSNLVRIADHFVSPDGFIGENPGILLNTYHYWSVDGIFSTGFQATGEFEYNGTTSGSQGHMDNDLIITEDSLVFMYREGAGFEWEEVNGYEVFTGASLTNKRGSVRIDTLKKGEYVLARRDFTASVSYNVKGEDQPFVYPNPTSGQVRFNLPNGHWHINLLDLRGKLVKNWSVGNDAEVNLDDLVSGTYLIEASSGNQKRSQKLIID